MHLENWRIECKTASSVKIAGLKQASFQQIKFFWKSNDKLSDCVNVSYVFPFLTWFTLFLIKNAA